MIATLIREGVQNPDGALQAIEFTQGFNLTMFGLIGGLDIINSRYKNAPVEMHTFLENMHLSLGGICHVNWEKRDLWHRLVVALTPQPIDSVHSLLPPGYIEELKDKRGSKLPDGEFISTVLINTPPLAMLLLLRWLRVDITEQITVLETVIKNRKTQS